MHNQTYSSHRVGLGDLVVYRGETTRAQINAGGGIAVKEREIQRLQPGLRVAGLISLCLVGGAVAWGRREEWEQVGWAALPLFCMTNAQINYWNLRLVLVLWHAWHLRKAPRPWHVAGLVWLFVVEMITQATKVAALDRYTTTTTTSLLMAVYLAGLVVWMVRAVREDGRLAT